MHVTARRYSGRDICDVSLLFHGMTNLCWWHVVLPLNFGNCRGVGASTFDGVAWLCACIDHMGARQCMMVMVTGLRVWGGSSGTV
jgi:hypothetical protein